MIPLGRTDLPEFALRWHTDDDLEPGAHVRRLERRGGRRRRDGASPLDLGGDYGGSLRWPAQCCGGSTLAPAPGRVPWFSALAPAELLREIVERAIEMPAPIDPIL